MNFNNFMCYYINFNLINFLHFFKSVWIPKPSIHSKNDYDSPAVQDFIIEKWILKKEKII